MSHRLLALYSAAHLWVDLSCAFLILGSLGGAPSFMLCLLLYNFCAFALQMPLGLLADGWNRNGLTAAAGCVLTALAYLSPSPLLTAVVAGIGNALFHLGGGIDVLNASEEKSCMLGIFVSPGALGLYLGGLWAKGGAIPRLLPPALLAVLAAAILLMCRNEYGSPRSRNVPVDLTPRGEARLLLPLIAVVALRSYMGLNQGFPWKGTGPWALILTLALVLGKAAGGFLSDRFGAKRAACASLGLAAALYLLSALPLPGTLAVFLFNMTMPITLWAAARLFPGAKGFAFGTLTFALFLGFLPSYLRWNAPLSNGWGCALIAGASLLLLLPALRKDAAPC